MAALFLVISFIDATFVKDADFDEQILLHHPGWVCTLYI